MQFRAKPPFEHFQILNLGLCAHYGGLEFRSIESQCLEHAAAAPNPLTATGRSDSRGGDRGYHRLFRKYFARILRNPRRSASSNARALRARGLSCSRVLIDSLAEEFGSMQIRAKQLIKMVMLTRVPVFSVFE